MNDSIFKLTKPRVLLLVIIGIFVLPMILAKFFMGYFSDHGISDTVNHGTLVSPAKPLMDMVLVDVDHNALPADVLKGKWTYVMLAESQCDELCEQQLKVTRNARLLSSKDMQRVNRLLVIAFEPDEMFLSMMKQEHPQVTIAVLTRSIWATFTSQFIDAINQMGGTPFFLVDPLGNLMMGYDELITPAEVFIDLKKLLKLSFIG